LIENSKYKDQDPLSVTILNCSNAGLTDLKGIEKLTKLEKLYCSDNKLISLKGIENLKKLIKLHCSDNELTSLKGIEKLTNLKILFCYSNNLEHKDDKDFKSVKEFRKVSLPF